MNAWIERREGNWQWKILAQWDFLLDGSPSWSGERWAGQYRVECIKQGDHRAVYRIETPQGVLYAKHYRSPRWTDPWRNFFRGCPARREFETLLALSERGVPTLRPIGWAKPVGLAGLWDSLLLTEAIPGALCLDEYLRIWWPKLPPADRPRITRRLLRQLAGFLARCHQAVKLGHHSVLLEADWPPPEEIFQQETVSSESKAAGAFRSPIPSPHFGGAPANPPWEGEKEPVSSPPLRLGNGMIPPRRGLRGRTPGHLVI